jgi:uncharacterized protein (DUF342 family)
MEAKRSLPCSQELNVCATKKKKAEIHRSVLAYSHNHLQSTSRKNKIFFSFSVQSDEMHTVETSTTPQTSGCQRVLRHNLLHTQLLVRSE